MNEFPGRLLNAISETNTSHYADTSSHYTEAQREDIILVLGLMTAFCSGLGLILHYLKQSLVIACVATGLVMGIWHDELSEMLPELFLHFLSELGIFFVLFTAGLEVDVQGFIDRWQISCIQGLGQISINMLVFLGLAFGVFGQTDMTSAVFFALCCTLSSTIVVLSCLGNRDEMSSVHGQVVLGIMVFQDVAAVVGIAVVNTLDPTQDSSVGLQIALIFVKLVVLLILLALIRFSILDTWLKSFGHDSDHMFFGILGYALGVSAACMALGFSGEMGSFWCGVTIASLPYRMEVEHKMQSIKVFGVTLFFIMLGFELQFTAAEFVDSIGLAVLLAFLVVFITPWFMIFLGILSKLETTISFYNGMTINQISEFSLLLASIAFKFQVFDQRTYLIIAFAAIISILISSVLHLVLPKLYKKLYPLFSWADKYAVPHTASAEHSHDFHGHIVLLGYNEIAQAMINHCSDEWTVILITDNASTHACIQAERRKRKHDPMSAEVMALSHQKRIHENAEQKSYRRSGVIQATKTHFGHLSEKFKAVYADFTDPLVWDHVDLEKATLVVSCLPEHHELNVVLSTRLSALVEPVYFVAVTANYSDPDMLYGLGVSYCIQTDHLAAENFAQILQKINLHRPGPFKSIKKNHQAELQLLKESLGETMYSA